MPQFNSCFTDSNGNKEDGVPYIEYSDGDGAKIIPFPYQHEDDICLYIENPTGTYTLQDTSDYTFGVNSQNKNTVTLTTSTNNPIHIMRRTDVCEMDAQFEPGASIRAQDLNHDFTQLLYLIQENRRALSQITGHNNGTLPIDPSVNLLWKRSSSTLEPVNSGDNIKVTGTTQFGSATYTWPSAVAGTTGQALTCSTTGQLSWTTVATGTSNVSEIETDTGSGLMCGTKGSENTGTATGDVSIVIDTGDGITINGNQVQVNAGDGLEFASGALRVDTENSTIRRTANGISVDVPFDEPTGSEGTTTANTYARTAAGDWALINAGDVTGIDAGEGIRIDAGDTATPEVNIRLASNSGLEFTGANNDLRIDVNGGLQLTGNGINVNEITIWGQTLNMTSNVNGDLAMGGADITFTDNANTVKLGAPTSLNATYELLFPVEAGANGNYLELQDASTGQMRWSTPTGSGTGGVVNQINANAGLSGGGSTANVDIAVELSANSGLQFSENTDSGTLQVAAGTGLSRNSTGLNVDSITLWNNTHDHSGNVDGTIRLGEGNTLQFQDNSSGQNRIGTLESANLSQNRTWILPDEGGTLGLATAALWNRVTGTPNVTRLANSGDTLQVQSGNIRSVDTNITIQPTGTGNANVELSSLNAGTIRLLDNTTIDATLTTTGAVDFDSTLTVDGNTTLGGDLDVDGTTTVDGLTSDGAVTVDGVVTIQNANNLAMGTGSITATGNIVLDPGGTGVVQVNSHLEVRNENALRLFDSGNTDAVRLKAANASATYDIEFPAASPAGADRVLQWNNANSEFEWIATPTSAAGYWQRSGSNLTTFNDDDTVTLNGHFTLDDESDGTNTQFRLPEANRATTAGSPNIAWEDDDGNWDTGFFQPNQNVIGISTAGTERARFDETRLLLQSGYDLRLTGANGTGEFQVPAAVNANRVYDLPNNDGTIALVGVGGLDNRYVAAAGDTMTGPLIMDDTTIQITEGNSTLVLAWPAGTGNSKQINFPDLAGTVALTDNDSAGYVRRSRNGEQTINSQSSANNLELLSEATGAIGATLTVRTDSSSPADDDVIGRIDFEGENSNDDAERFARIDVVATDVSDGDETAEVRVSVFEEGTETERLRVGGGTVQYNGNNLPTDGQFGSRNLIRNPEMTVAQVASSTDEHQAFGCDMWQHMFNGGAATLAIINCENTPPTPEGPYRALRCTNDTAGTAANNYRDIRTRVENRMVYQSGWDFDNPNSNVVLSFWVRASISQPYYVMLRSRDDVSAGGTNKNFCIPVVDENGANPAANTWMRVEQVIPGHGDLEFSNGPGEGFMLLFAPTYGTGYTGMAAGDVQTWQDWDSNNRCPDYNTGAGSWQQTQGATFDITGVQLEVGNVATPFEKLPYDQHLERCRRYYQLLQVNRFSDARSTWTFPTRMRTQPSTSSSATITIRRDGFFLAPQSGGIINLRFRADFVNDPAFFSVGNTYEWEDSEQTTVIVKDDEGNLVGQFAALQSDENFKKLLERGHLIAPYQEPAPLTTEQKIANAGFVGDELEDYLVEKIQLRLNE